MEERDGPGARLVRVVLPAQLRILAGVEHEVWVDVVGEVTQRSVLDALESRFPTLGGTIRDRSTARRRPFVRFFVGEEDLSHEAPDFPLPAAVASGHEPFVVLGAIAGG
ncbi:MAG: MoaD/ThiS family protein [Acidimicrobiales bacterium]